MFNENKAQCNLRSYTLLKGPQYITYVTNVVLTLKCLSYHAVYMCNFLPQLKIKFLFFKKKKRKQKS